MDINKQNELYKLKIGILFAYQNKIIREPEYAVIDSLTEKSSTLSKMNQYASDIEKIIREMNFTFRLIEKLPTDSYLQQLNIAPEDYILYHQGYFLELVHQTKDKIFNLIDAFSKINEKIYEEKTTNVKIKDIIKRDKIVNHQNLIDLINEWGQEGNNLISSSLLKRAKNHHSRSDLHLAPSYQNIKFSKVLIDAHRQQNVLSEYGIEQMELRGKKGFEKWHKDTKVKILNTKKFIEQNIESISKLLILIFNLPTLTNKNGMRNALISYSGCFIKEIENKTSLKKLQSTDIFYGLVRAIELILKSILNEQLVSFYVIGSTARGEPKFRISDLNLVIVTKSEVPSLSETIRESLVNPQFKIFSKMIFDIDVKVLSKEQFLDSSYFKIAFSCRYDGLLILGEDLARQKKYPLPGLGLAYLLNKDFKNEIEKTKALIKSDIQLSEDALMRLVRKTSKDSLRMLFGEVMANHTLYAVEIKEIKDLLIWAHHNNWKFIAMFYYFLRKTNIITSRKNLEAMIDFFCIEKLYPLLDDIEKKSKNWFIDWQKKY